ncbi:MAG TPA: hypothetical protein VHF69_12160 [Candidatus Synoicihabitans sp.]|nr:hypothetical protein [Candidatus Synoicihabitans sp.]
MPLRPIVILDESCAHLRGPVAGFSDVSVFRRANGFRTSALIAARELKDFADELGATEALYIAPSFAAYTGLILASERDSPLVGLLLIDPSHPRQGPEAVRILADATDDPEVERLRTLLAGFGPTWDESCDAVSRIHRLDRSAVHVLAGDQFDLLPSLPAELKLRLIQNRQAMLAEYCHLSPRSRFRVVGGAGHDVCHDAPEAVIAAIRRLIAEVLPMQVS